MTDASRLLAGKAKKREDKDKYNQARREVLLEYKIDHLRFLNEQLKNEIEQFRNAFPEAQAQNVSITHEIINDLYQHSLSPTKIIRNRQSTSHYASILFRQERTVFLSRSCFSPISISCGTDSINQLPFSLRSWLIWTVLTI